MFDNKELDFDFNQADIDSAMEELELELEAKEKADEEDDKDIEDDSDTKLSEEALACSALMDIASESDIEEIAASTEAMEDVSEMMGIAMERTIVRLDRKARLRHLSKQSELDAARLANDPNYKKLLKIWQLERTLEKKIHLRWGNKGKQIAMKKIKDYASNGKRIAKPNPSTVSFKGKVSGRVAQNAVNKSKAMFSHSNNKTAEKK